MQQAPMTLLVVAAGNKKVMFYINAAWLQYIKITWATLAPKSKK